MKWALCQTVLKNEMPLNSKIMPLKSKIIGIFLALYMHQDPVAPQCPADLFSGTDSVAPVAPVALAK